MRIIEFNDIHFGYRSHPLVEREREKFARWALGVVREQKPDLVIINGDLFDNRRMLNIVDTHRAKSFVLGLAEVCGVYISIGNHDIPFTNTLDKSSVSLIFEGHRNVEVIDESFWDEGGNFAVVPWITKSSEQTEMRFLESLDEHGFCGFLFTHMDIVGSQLSASSVKLPEGFQRDVFPSGAKVINGHIHWPSEFGNVVNVGIQYDMSRVWIGGEKRFPLLDTESMEIEWFVNPSRLFYRYDEELPEDLTDKVVLVDPGVSQDVVEGLKKRGASIDVVQMKKQDDGGKRKAERKASMSRVVDLSGAVREYLENSEVNGKVAKAVEKVVLKTIDEVS